MASVHPRVGVLHAEPALTTLREVIAPVASAYAFVAVVIMFASRHVVSRPPRPLPLTRERLARLVRYFAVMAAGGYVVLLAVVLVFGVLIIGDDGSLPGAATGGLFLLAVASPVFLVLQWLFGRRG